jgi:flagella basal body P-ring formation protein FlgA
MPLEVGRYRFDAGRTVDIGNISFRITDLKSKRKSKKSLTAKVYYLCDTVIAKYDLKKNEVITEMNVELSQVKILSKRDIGVSDIMQVLNQQVRSPMRKGETIHFNKIKRLDLIHKGDIVKVLHSVGNIKMDFSGYAQKTGARGDIITVVNVYDKRQKNIVRVKASGIVVVLNNNIVKEPIAQNNLNSRSTYK